MISDPKSPGKPRVLIIDDEIGPRESMRFLLNREYEVLCAAGVEAGLASLEAFDPDVVVMDIRMPGIDGIEGLRRLRKSKPLVSVIMLTGYGTLDTAREAIRLGANDYLKKPFDTREMLKIIAENVSRSLFHRRRVETEEDLRRLNESLMAEIEHKRSLATLGQTSAELAHDLRNPLTAVMGCVQMLSLELRDLQNSLPGSDRGTQALEYLDVIEKSTRRCTELLDIWRNLGKNTEWSRKPVRIDNLLRGLLDEARALDRNRGSEITLHNSLPEEACVLGDAAQLARALMNIVSNALDALPAENGRIAIEADRSPEGFLLRIRDNGSGIEPEVQRKMFEPYFTTKPEGRGTGLGLFITRRIVEKHGGDISACSEIGQGSTFAVHLPLHTPAPPESDAP